MAYSSAAQSMHSAGAAAGPAPASPQRKRLVLMRGLPGSGKSTLARGLGGLILSTDDFFVDAHGNYVFDIGRLDEAHRSTYTQAKNAMQRGEPLIVIDNTNLQAWEMLPYVKEGRKCDYRIELMEPDTSWRYDVEECARRNSHGVPQDKIQAMMQRFQRNITVSDLYRRATAGRREGIPRVGPAAARPKAGPSMSQTTLTRHFASPTASPAAKAANSDARSAFEREMQTLRRKQTQELEDYRREGDRLRQRHQAEVEAVRARFRAQSAAHEAAPRQLIESPWQPSAAAAGQDVSPPQSPAARPPSGRDAEPPSPMDTDMDFGSQRSASSHAAAQGAVASAEHLQMLGAMGFTNEQANRRALDEANNDIARAVGILTSLASSPPATRSQQQQQPQRLLPPETPIVVDDSGDSAGGDQQHATPQLDQETEPPAQATPPREQPPAQAAATAMPSPNLGSATDALFAVMAEPRDATWPERCRRAIEAVEAKGGDDGLVLECRNELSKHTSSEDASRPSPPRRQEEDQDADPAAGDIGDDIFSVAASEEELEELRQLQPEDAEARLFAMLDSGEHGEEWCRRLECLIDALGHKSVAPELRMQAEARLHYARVGLLLASIGPRQGHSSGEELLKALLPDLIPDVSLSKALQVFGDKDGDVHETVAELLQLQLLEKAAATAALAAPEDEHTAERRKRADGGFSLADELQPRGDYSPPKTAKMRSRRQNALQRLSQELPLSRETLRYLLEAAGGDADVAHQEALHICRERGLAVAPGSQASSRSVSGPLSGNLYGTRSYERPPDMRDLMLEQELHHEVSSESATSGAVARLQSRFPDLSSASIRRELIHNGLDERATAEALLRAPATRNVYASGAVYDISTPRHYSPALTAYMDRTRGSSRDIGREEARHYRNMCAVNMQKASEAYKRREFAVGDFYASEARRLRRLVMSADARASNAIFDQNNPDPTARRSIDLHGLHVEEAKSQLTKLLNFHQARRSRGQLFVITGKGLHSSSGQSRLLPAVKSVLRARNVTFTQEEGGVSISLRSLWK